MIIKITTRHEVPEIGPNFTPDQRVHWIDSVETFTTAPGGRGSAEGATQVRSFGSAEVSEENGAPHNLGLAGVAYTKEGKFVGVEAYSVVDAFLMSDTGDTIDRLA